MDLMDSPFVSAFAAAVVFANTWQGQFVYDDSRAIVSNEDLRPSSSWRALWGHDFWGTPLDHPGSHQSWRPLCVLSFRLNYYWSGLDPSSYHLVNVILHALVTLCFTLLVRPLIRQRWARILVGLTFAVHPIHSEAVASVVGRAELGMALHTLVALLAYRAHLGSRSLAICCRSHDGGGGWRSSFYLMASLIAAGSAILWKESGTAALPLCAMLELFHRPDYDPEERGSNNNKPGNPQPTIANQWMKRLKSARLSNLAFIGSLWMAQLVLRLYMLGVTPWFALADNPVARDPSFLSRSLTFLHLPAFNLGLVLWPAWLSFDWSMDAIRPLRTLGDPRNLATGAFYAGLALLAYRSLLSRRHSTLLGLSLLILPFLPASNLFVYVGFVVAERVLYLPSAGFCLLLGVGLDRILAGASSCGRKRLVQIGLALTLVFSALRTIQRNGDWASEEQLYRSGLSISPAKAYGNLAAILAREERHSEAEYAYRQALAHRPNMAETHFNLALLLDVQGRHQEATSSYLQSIHYRPNLAAAYLNLGQLMIKQGRHDQAVRWFSACTQLDGSGVRDPQAHRHSQVQALIRWGQAEMARGQPQRAIQLLKQAARRPPSHAQQLQSVYQSLGEAYELTGDYHESERWFLKAVQQPDHHHHHLVSAHLTYARFLAKNASRHEEAERIFRQAQIIAPNDPAVYMQSGQFLLDVSRPREAAESFVRAAHLAPGDFEAVFNAAATLREVEELDRAEHYYRRAVQLRPRDVEVYRNLGALLHVKGQWKEAEDNYRTALKLSPDDGPTLTNLQRLHQTLAKKGLLGANSSATAPSHNPSES